MKKRVISIVAIILAVIIAALSIGITLSKCSGKKVVQVVMVDTDKENTDDDEDDNTDDADDEDNSGAGDAINLDLGYTDSSYKQIGEIGDSDDLCNLYVYNDESGLLVNNYRGLKGSVYHATEFLDADPNDRYYTDEMIDLEFKRYRDAGFKYMRTQFKSDWMYSGDDSNPWDWESEKMLGFYEFCKKAEEYDIEVLIVLGWLYSAMMMGGTENDSFLEVPYLMPRELDENGNPIVVRHWWGIYSEKLDYEEQNRRYANWGVELIKALERHGVKNANNFIVFNEPKENGGMITGAYIEYEKETFLTLHNALKDAGLRDKVTLIGPNQNSKSGSAGMAAAFMADPKYAEIFDVYSSHSTPSAAASTDDLYDAAYALYTGYMQKMEDFELINKKEFWLDEFTTNGDNNLGNNDSNEDGWQGTQICTTLLAAMNAGISAVSTWQFIDQTWVGYYGSGGEYKYGAQILGSMRSLYNSETPFPSYYAVSLFSKFSGEKNGKTYKTEYSEDHPGVYVGAVQLSDGGWSIFVINMTTDTQEINVNLEKSLGGVTLYRYKYSPSTVKPTSAAKLITADKGFKNVEKNIVDTLEGGAVAVYSTMEYFG